MSAVAYAELLTNIHQITVYICLPTSCDISTTIKLSSDCRSVIIQHQGATSTVQLPCQVTDDIRITQPAAGSNDLSLRFPISKNSSSQIGRMQGGDVPWPASSLTLDTQVACQSCTNVLIDRTIHTWKDLPSENWAEMMDFWHCHKPDTEETPGTHTHNVTKGYSASNRLSPLRGIGLVAISYFEICDSDCVGIQVCMKSNTPLITLVVRLLSISEMHKTIHGVSRKSLVSELSSVLMTRSLIQIPKINSQPTLPA